MQRKPSRDARDVGSGVRRGQPLEEERLVLLENGELRVLTDRGLHALHERHRGLAKAQRVRTAQGELPQAHAEAHAMLVVALEQPRFDECLDLPVGGRRRQVRASADLRGRLHGALRREGLEDAHDPLGDGVARRRVGHAPSVPHPSRTLSGRVMRVPPHPSRAYADAVTTTTSSLPVTAAAARDDRITLRFMSVPGDTAAGGRSVAAGSVMEWIDKAGYACAVGWAGTYCVTAYVGNVRHRRPIAPGSLIEVARAHHPHRTHEHARRRHGVLERGEHARVHARDDLRADLRGQGRGWAARGGAGVDPEDPLRSASSPTPRSSASRRAPRSSGSCSTRTTPTPARLRARRCASSCRRAS